mmetsp:Transcript_2173/g.8099  ORF Transcript_2173/g.8099 Transcript_2173/m.8099 type:complete len:271 (+) Transcript_2173:5309-6121(+)
MTPGCFAGVSNVAFCVAASVVSTIWTVSGSRASLSLSKMKRRLFPSGTPTGTSTPSTALKNDKLANSPVPSFGGVSIALDGGTGVCEGVAADSTVFTGVATPVTSSPSSPSSSPPPPGVFSNSASGDEIPLSRARTPASMAHDFSIDGENRIAISLSWSTCGAFAARAACASRIAADSSKVSGASAIARARTCVESCRKISRASPRAASKSPAAKHTSLKSSINSWFFGRSAIPRSYANLATLNSPLAAAAPPNRRHNIISSSSSSTAAA